MAQFLLPLEAQRRRDQDGGASAGLGDGVRERDGDARLAHADLVGDHHAVLGQAPRQSEQAGPLPLVQV